MLCIVRVGGANTHLSPTVKKSKQEVLDQETAARLQLTADVNTWFYANRVTHECSLYDKTMGKAIMPIMCGTHPEKCIQARERIPKHVKEVYSNMKMLGVSKRSDVVILFWQEDLDDNEITLDDLPLTNDILTWHVICGDHTIAAQQKCYQENPTNVDFQFIPVEIVVCKKTQENVFFAYSCGQLDNETKKLTQGTTAWDIVSKIHDSMEICDAMRVTPEIRKKRFATMMEKLFQANSGIYKKPSFGSLRVLGQKTGRVWENIKEIFTRVPPDTPKGVPKIPPPSINHFYNLSDIPEKDVVRWTDRVLTTSWTSLELNKRCLRYKKEQRVKALFIEYVNIIRPDTKATSYEMLCDYYGFFADEEWLDRSISWCSDKVKDPLNSSVKASILKAIEMAEKKEAEQKSQVQVIFVIYVNCII